MRLSITSPTNWHKKPCASSSRARGELSSYLVILIICFCILAGALILKPVEPGTSFIRLGRVPLPDMCIFRATTGLPCPGCGLTRSIVAAAHGDVNKSLTYHRLGLLTLVYIFLQFVFSLGILVIPKWRTRVVRYGKFLNRGIIILGILFMLNWILAFFLKGLLQIP